MRQSATLLLCIGFSFIWNLSKLLKFDKNFKILWANFVKLFNHLTAFTSQAPILFHTTFLLVSFVVQSPKTSFFLDPLVQKLFFDKHHWRQLLPTKKDWMISLFLISIILNSPSLNNSIMSSVSEETSFCFR